ncbi:MAG: NAD-dependent epimerase/dehydratase family protein [Thermoleophilaceae bacterium]
MKKFVFKSSTHFYGANQDDPAFFDEAMGRPHPPGTAIERDILEAEASVAEFADRNPGVSVSVLRFANVLGPAVDTSHIDMFGLPAVPMILGFDPRYQFVHEDDVVHALEHVVQNELPGVFNVAADGVLALSEVAGLLGKPYAPVLPPWGTGLAAAVARRLGVDIPSEMLAQLRFGRGVDNRRLKAAGFRLRLHQPRGGGGAGRAHAPFPAAAQRRRALPLRARGGGVPALEPQRAQRPAEGPGGRGPGPARAAGGPLRRPGRRGDHLAAAARWSGPTSRRCGTTRPATAAATT